MLKIMEYDVSVQPKYLSMGYPVLKQERKVLNLHRQINIFGSIAYIFYLFFFTKDGVALLLSRLPWLFFLLHIINILTLTLFSRREMLCIGIFVLKFYLPSHVQALNKDFMGVKKEFFYKESCEKREWYMSYLVTLFNIRVWRFFLYSYSRVILKPLTIALKTVFISL